MNINECDFITPGSGNVFKDLELPNAEELFLKAELTNQIDSIIKQKRLTKKATCKLLNLKQPELSKLTTGHLLREISLNQLICFLDLLGHKVTLQVTPKKVPKVRVRKPIALPKKVKRVTPLPRPVGSTTARIQARKK